MKKAGSHFPWRSSLFSRAIFWLPIILACAPIGSNLKAITISAVYTSACQRDLGVIIDADTSKIRLLTLDGDIKRIDRFSIIYISF